MIHKSREYTPAPRASMCRRLGKILQRLFALADRRSRVTQRRAVPDAPLILPCLAAGPGCLQDALLGKCDEGLLSSAHTNFLDLLILPSITLYFSSKQIGIGASGLKTRRLQDSSCRRALRGLIIDEKPGIGRQVHEKCGRVWRRRLHS